MEYIAKTLILSGIAVGLISQLVAAGLVLRHNAFKGLLTLFMPGYIFTVPNENGHYNKVIGAWLAGMFAMVLGMTMIS